MAKNDTSTEAEAMAVQTTLTVAFTAPADGGSPITGYEITVAKGELKHTASAAAGATSATIDVDDIKADITTLAKGDKLDVTMTATNAVGTSAPSAAKQTNEYDNTPPAAEPQAPTVDSAALS